MQIRWLQLKSVMSYRTDKYILGTDGRTDGGNDNTPSASKGLKWNIWYHFHFYFDYHLVYFQLKTNSGGITEESVGPMANDMYFIQWIIASYYTNGYEIYRNNSMCTKIACISYWSHIQSTFNWCCKMLWWVSCKTNTITPINSFWSSDTKWWQEIWVIIGSGYG